MWFVFAFALFSLMLTKFHHYILPALPPAAMLTGVLLDGMLRSAPGPSEASILARRVPLRGGARGGHGRRAGRRDVARRRAARALAGEVVPRFGSPSRGWARPAAITALGVATIVATILLAGRAAPQGDEAGEDGDGVFRARFERVLFGAVGVAGALLVLAVGRDMAETFEGLPNQIRL